MVVAMTPVRNAMHMILMLRLNIALMALSARNLSCGSTPNARSGIVRSDIV